MIGVFYRFNSVGFELTLPALIKAKAGLSHSKEMLAHFEIPKTSYGSGVRTSLSIF